MKPTPKFGRLKAATVASAAKPAAKPGHTRWNIEHEERAAIHEFDGKLSREEAESRAADECQHCGKVAKLEGVTKPSYGYGLSVCGGCAENLVGKGWERTIV